MRISAPFSPEPKDNKVTYSFPKEAFDSETMVDKDGYNIVPLVGLKRDFTNNSYQFVKFRAKTIRQHFITFAGNEHKAYTFSEGGAPIPGFPQYVEN